MILMFESEIPTAHPKYEFELTISYRITNPMLNDYFNKTSFLLLDNSCIF